MFRGILWREFAGFPLRLHRYSRRPQLYHALTQSFPYPARPLLVHVGICCTNVSRGHYEEAQVHCILNDLVGAALLHLMERACE